jgi:hypothetical protein
MKKIFFAIAVCGLIFTACGNKTNENKEDVHSHGTEMIHDESHGHDHGKECDHTHEKPVQESFDISQDSIQS